LLYTTSKGSRGLFMNTMHIDFVFKKEKINRKNELMMNEN
jgi:hypothetical protein